MDSPYELPCKFWGLQLKKRPSYDCLCFEFGKIAAAAAAAGVGGKL